MSNTKVFNLSTNNTGTNSNTSNNRYNNNTTNNRYNNSTSSNTSNNRYNNTGYNNSTSSNTSNNNYNRYNNTGHNNSTSSNTCNNNSNTNNWDLVNNTPKQILADHFRQYLPKEVLDKIEKANTVIDTVIDKPEEIIINKKIYFNKVHNEEEIAEIIRFKKNKKELDEIKKTIRIFNEEFDNKLWPDHPQSDFLGLKWGYIRLGCHTITKMNKDGSKVEEIKRPLFTGYLNNEIIPNLTYYKLPCGKKTNTRKGFTVEHNNKKHKVKGRLQSKKIERLYSTGSGINIKIVRAFLRKETDRLNKIQETNEITNKSPNNKSPSKSENKFKNNIVDDFESSLSAQFENNQSTNKGSVIVTLPAAFANCSQNNTTAWKLFHVVLPEDFELCKKLNVLEYEIDKYITYDNGTSNMNSESNFEFVDDEYESDDDNSDTELEYNNVDEKEIDNNKYNDMYKIANLYIKKKKTSIINTSVYHTDTKDIKAQRNSTRAEYFKDQMNNYNNTSIEEIMGTYAGDNIINSAGDNIINSAGDNINNYDGDNINNYDGNNINNTEENNEVNEEVNNEEVNIIKLKNKSKNKDKQFAKVIDHEGELFSYQKESTKKEKGRRKKA